MKGAVAAVIAAAAAWFLVSGPLRHSDPGGTMVTPVEAEETGRSIYYQDPDGKPSYSATPRKTSDGRAYRAIPASADISFDDAVETAPAKSAGTTERKIKYYRNPMGLSGFVCAEENFMGMDYIPVYEGDDSDDGSVRLSPGRIQRTGVKSEPAARRVIRAMVRAPGVIQLDERRVSVISMRSESFILKVANVTTGSHVVKGQPLMEVYSPAVASAAADSWTTPCRTPITCPISRSN